MSRPLMLFCFATSCLLCTGCISLSSTERTKLAELKSKGVRVPSEQIKQPIISGVLNILPGFGNFYNAVGSNESEQYVVGFLNLLTWPISILWGVPEAAIDANTINTRETIYYYTYGPGAKTLESKEGAKP